MDIARLAAILGVPAPLVEAQSEAEWARVEAELGTPLPADYRAFVGYFGSVEIGTVFVTYSPFDTLKTVNLLAETRKLTPYLRTIPDYDLPYPLFPDNGGLLPWGSTTDDGILFWQTIGAPNEWTVVVGLSIGGMFEEYDCDMTTFIGRWATKEIESRIISQLQRRDNPLVQS